MNDIFLVKFVGFLGCTSKSVAAILLERYPIARFVGLMVDCIEEDCTESSDRPVGVSGP